MTDAANGIFVSSSRTDTDTNDIAAGLSNCITKDGQQTVTANIPMAGFVFTGLGAGAANGQSIRYEQLLGYAPLSLCEFRLTLTTGVPVTTADVTAATTVYASPYKGNRIALYDGSANWTVFNSAEMSIAVPATTSTMYDLFCYNNSGTPTLEALAWTNDTTRATALVLQNGVYVKTGATTRRYLGSFRTTGVSGQTEDSLAKRYVWNYYNRVRRPMRVLEATATWTYTTATVRQANGAAANQIDMVIGVSEDPVSAEVSVGLGNTSAGILVTSGIGLDVTNAFYSLAQNATWSTQSVAGVHMARSSVRTYPTVGRHFLAWLEYSTATGTTTWYANTNNTNGGITGELLG